MSDFPSPSRAAAFFDVDCTLLAVNSARKWIGHRWRRGRMSIPSLLRTTWWLVQHRLSVLDADRAAESALRDYAGTAVVDLEAEIAEWFEREIVPTLTIQGREAVAGHRAAGDMLVLLSSGPRYSLAHLSRLLDIEHVLCTEPEVRDGKMTGRIVPPACYGPGKVCRAEAFAAEHGIDLARSYFYTDSYSDLPMLRRVGQPRTVNPDPRLLRYARAQNWKIERWTMQTDPKR